MPRFRKLPVEIDAIEYNGRNSKEVTKFTNGNAFVKDVNGDLVINTAEGEMKCSIGDWIIKEAFPTSDRQFYPCKPDIFIKTYESVHSINYGQKNGL